MFVPVTKLRYNKVKLLFSNTRFKTLPSSLSGLHHGAKEVNCQKGKWVGAFNFVACLDFWRLKFAKKYNSSGNNSLLYDIEARGGAPTVGEKVKPKTHSTKNKLFLYFLIDFFQ